MVSTRKDPLTISPSTTTVAFSVKIPGVAVAPDRSRGT